MRGSASVSRMRVCLVRLHVSWIILSRRACLAHFSPILSKENQVRCLFFKNAYTFSLLFFCIKVKLSTMRYRVPYICRFFLSIYDFVGFYILKLYSVFAEMQHFTIYGYKIQRLSSLCVLIFDKEFFFFKLETRISVRVFMTHNEFIEIIDNVSSNIYIGDS